MALRKKNPYAPKPKVHTLNTGQYATTVGAGIPGQGRTYTFSEKPGTSIIAGGQNLRVPGGPSAGAPNPTSPATPGSGVGPGSKPTDPGLPLSMGEQAQRNAADAAYGTSKSGYGRQLYEAALRYGDQGTMGQWGEYGPAVENPNSRLATTARNEAQGVEQSGLRSNANNTFFSGLHLRADQEIHDQASRERLAAQQEYESSMNNLMNLLAQAEQARSGVYSSTGASAIDRELGREPIPGAGPPVGSPQQAAIQAGWTRQQAAGGPSPGPGWKWDAARFKWVRR